MSSLVVATVKTNVITRACTKLVKELPLHTQALTSLMEDIFSLLPTSTSPSSGEQLPALGKLSFF